MNNEEQKWQARSDARTLAEALVIRKDSARMDRARAAAGELLKEQTEQAEREDKVADALRSVAKKGKQDYSREFDQAFRKGGR
jgi:hypothetical protein